MHVIGHRGAAMHAPENSLAGLRYVATHHIKQVECDISVASDGVAVVFHDEYLARLTGDPRAILATSASDLESLRLWFNESPTHETIPTARQWFDECARLGLFLHCEIKVHDAEVTRVVDACLDAFQASNLSLSQIRFSSFSVAAIERVRAQLPESSVGLACHTLIEIEHLNWDDLGLESIHLAVDEASNSALQSIADRQRQACLYTVNTEHALCGLKPHLIHAVFSDDPVQFAAAVKTAPAGP
jgi:glycerophosphoryl diester phosphodiesterase